MARRRRGEETTTELTVDQAELHGAWYVHQAMRYVVTHPSETRPSLIVRTCPAIRDEDIERLRDDMFGAGCSNGLLFDATRCAILRDTFESMSRDAIVVEAGEAETDKVLTNAGAGSLDERVRRWLEMMIQRIVRAARQKKCFLSWIEGIEPPKSRR